MQSLNVIASFSCTLAARMYDQTPSKHASYMALGKHCCISHSPLHHVADCYGSEPEPLSQIKGELSQLPPGIQQRPRAWRWNVLEKPHSRVIHPAIHTQERETGALKEPRGRLFNGTLWYQRLNYSVQLVTTFSTICNPIHPHPVVLKIDPVTDIACTESYYTDLHA